MRGESAPFEAEFTRFLELFNQERFWESHEVLEGAWRRRRSPFYQGIIIYASAFVHAQRGNLPGIIKQMAKVRARLEPYRPYYLGLDVEAILQEAEAWTRWAQGALSTPGPPEPIRPFPRLVASPPRVRGDEPERLPS